MLLLIERIWGHTNLSLRLFSTIMSQRIMIGLQSVIVIIIIIICGLLLTSFEIKTSNVRHI